MKRLLPIVLVISMGAFFPSLCYAGKAVLKWTAPTRNTDGSALTNLAGYKILSRKKGTTTWSVRTIANPGATTVTYWNLPVGVRYQFAMKSYTNTGVQSVRTGIVETTI